MPRAGDRGGQRRAGGAGRRACGAGGCRARRWVSLAAALVTALAGVGPASGSAPGGDGLLPPGDWSDEQQAFLLDLIERTEAALPTFADTTRIGALGFEDFGVTAAGGYDHWNNEAWYEDEHVLDPEHPESLVFRATLDGPVLESAMFVLPSGYDMSTIPEDIAWLPGWHAHPEVCLGETGTVTGFVRPDGTCEGGAPLDMAPMMHVWIVDTPCGHRFASIGSHGLHCDVGHALEPGEARVAGAIVTAPDYTG